MSAPTQQSSANGPSPLTSLRPIFPNSDDPLSAVQILQVWGIWPDLKRGRKSLTRPWEPFYPPYITRTLEQERQSYSNGETYMARASAAVISELWTDAKRGDSRLSEPSNWVAATVSSSLVHPAVDRIDASDTLSRPINVLYLTIPNNKVRLFEGIGVVGVRDPRANSVRLLEVKRLKRHTNQLVVHLEHMGTATPSARSIPQGTTFDVAPFCGIKTRNAELRAIADLSKKSASAMDMLCLPHLPIARVEEDDELVKTYRPDPSRRLRTVPDRFNRRAWNANNVFSPSPASVHPPPASIPGLAPDVPAHQLDHVPNPVNAVLQDVDQLDQGIVMVQA